MGFTYLFNKNWDDITREERFFCMHLYWDIKGKEKEFVRWLNDKQIRLNAKDEWEISYEVCFYRDLLKFQGKSVDPEKYSAKRTFDLCLFSENTIIIIEAKVQQPFHKSQVITFKEDKTNIKSIIGKEINVMVIALASSTYFENYEIYGKNGLLSMFDKKITWEDMHALYNNKIYLKANEMYRH